MTAEGLADRVFVVTGGASGVGLATARALIAAGARVGLFDLDDAGLQRVANKDGDERMLAVRVDVSSEDEVRRAFASVRERFGQIDGLHNNAGIMIPRTPIADLAIDDFDKVVRVNLRGAFLCLREMLREAKTTGTAGAIVNTGSGTALRGAPGASAYSATKAALLALTRTAALEAAPRVRVNAVIPGPLQTPMTAGIPPEQRAKTIDRLPLARVGTAEDVAGLVCWLLSDEARFVTGALYSIDGGETA